VVTIDTPVSGIRERDFRNGMKELISGGPFEKIPYLPQILSRPGWLDQLSAAMVACLDCPM
jgi:L-lactate dehydrogenase (cytochrome)